MIAFVSAYGYEIYPEDILKVNELRVKHLNLSPVKRITVSAQVLKFAKKITEK